MKYRKASIKICYHNPERESNYVPVLLCWKQYLFTLGPSLDNPFQPVNLPPHNPPQACTDCTPRKGSHRARIESKSDLVLV